MIDIYLAAPYTNPDPEVEHSRFLLATAAAAKLVGQGFTVYSPLTMTHPIHVAMAAKRQLSHAEWCWFDETYMQYCSGMIVLKLPGWEVSAGIKREIKYFEQRDRPVSYMDPVPLNLTAAARLTGEHKHE